MFGHVSEGGNYPIAEPGGDWKSLVMEIVLITILVSVILNTGCWVYVAGPVIGSAIAVMIIGLVRGLPDKDSYGDCPTKRRVPPPRAATCRSTAPPPLSADGH